MKFGSIVWLRYLSFFHRITYLSVCFLTWWLGQHQVQLLRYMTALRLYMTALRFYGFCWIFYSSSPNILIYGSITSLFFVQYTCVHRIAFWHICFWNFLLFPSLGIMHIYYLNVFQHSMLWNIFKYVTVCLGKADTISLSLSLDISTKNLYFGTFLGLCFPFSLKIFLRK